MNADPKGKPPAGRRAATLEPFGSLRSEIDRVFNDFSRGFRLPEMFAGDVQFLPDMDIHENDKSITVTVELPGVEEKDIDVSATGDTLTVKGEKKMETETKEGDGYRRERSYGSFARTLTVPFDIDAGSVDAKFDKGVLTVTLTKPSEPERKPSRIAIKS